MTLVKRIAMILLVAQAEVVMAETMVVEAEAVVAETVVIAEEEVAAIVTRVHRPQGKEEFWVPAPDTL